MNDYFADIATDLHYSRDALDQSLCSFGDSDLASFVPFSHYHCITVYVCFCFVNVCD